MSFDQLLLAGESQTLEFKTSFDKTTVESLVAFANAQGGKVLVGVSDAGLIRGVTLGKETLNEWLGQIKSATSPSLIPDLVAENVDGKTVGIIQVSEFPVKPVSTRGRYFKRVASSNHQLGLAEIANLYMQSLQLSWDAYEAPNESLDALSLPKINRFINQVNDSGRFALESEPLAALEKLKYIVNGHPTWAALLLFAKEPLRHHIHIGRFKTPSMIIDDRQFTDTLFEVVDQSMKFIISYISVAFEFDGIVARLKRVVTTQRANKRNARYDDQATDQRVERAPASLLLACRGYISSSRDSAHSVFTIELVTSASHHSNRRSTQTRFLSRNLPP